jgi:hypothetical protein
VLDPYVHATESYRRDDSKFIGYNKRLPVEITAHSHPITFSLNRAVCRDITQYGDFHEDLLGRQEVTSPSTVILAIDGCQNPYNFNQANASTAEVHQAIGAHGPASAAHDPIPIGPNRDEASSDGWIRYADGRAHALMCDGSTRRFPMGTITKANIWYKTAE